MRLKQLLARQAGILHKIKGIEEAAGDKPLTDEQRANLKALREESKVLAEDIAEARATEDLERSLMARQPVDPQQTEVERQAAEAQGRVEVGADRSASDPTRGFSSPREYLVKIMDFSRTRRMDARLKPLHQQASAGSDEQSGFSDPYGAFLVPAAYSPNLLSVQAEGDPTAGRTTMVPMDAPMVKINARVDKNHSSSVSGGLTVTRHPEAVDATSSRMKFEQVGLEAAELLGLAYATESILTDSPSSFAAIIAAGFKDEFNTKVLDEKLNGSGVGEYLGVLNSPALITVAKESGQTAATILKENIDKMAARCWRYGQAIYLANHTTRPQLRSIVQKVGTGGAPVPYFTQSNGQEYLDGRPIFFTEFAQSLGTVGDLILGVWSEYLEGLYQPMEQAESIHVRFVQHERAFKFWLRNDGMPWWRTALTPKHGDTLSPFVALATRS